MPRDKKYLKLGELLVKEGLITEAQLEKAISIQRQEGGRLGEIVVRLGVVKEDQMVTVLGKQLNIPYFSLGTGMLKPAVDQGLDNLIPRDFAYKNSVLPLSRTLNSITVAMSDPLDLILIDSLRRLTGCEINPVIATPSDIGKAVEDFYGKARMFEEAVEASYDISIADSIAAEDSGVVEQELSLDKLIARAEEAPVVKLVDLIIRQAIDERASDIHIEPFRDRISLRYRIDGKLYEIPPPAKHLHLPIISRIKILAKLDIAEKRLPQDGAFLVRVDNRPIDLRISTVPTIYGEKIVLRILDRSSVVLDLNQLGFEGKQLEDIRKAASTAYGLLFLTGPTGSGKTTTLYAILNETKSPSKNIVTVEDPVEYKLDGVNQIQVKPEIGLTFSGALRSFLRQDPDIMLVGEVRDLETAQICVRSALTGHLVLSTLHTNDAPSAVTRLIDIGIEPYLLAPSLLLIVAQRLIRKLCPECKEAYEPTAEQLKSVTLKAGLIYRPKGCAKCSQTGYKGRACIAETMFVNKQIQDMIFQRASFQKIREVARASGMQTLYESAIKKVESGLMPKFYYTARDKTGKKVTGVEDAATRDEIVSKLQAKELIVLDISMESKEVQGELRPEVVAQSKFRPKHYRISGDDLVLFCRQLATLLGSGVTILKSLDIISQQVSSKRLFMIIKDMQKSMEQGLSLHDAMTKHSNVFSELWINLVESGEASGNLAMVLTRLATYLEKNAAFKRKIVSALIYPVILLLAGLSALLFLTLKIIPTFAQLFKGFNITLPVLTQILIWVSEFIRKYIFGIIVVAGVAFYLFNKYKSTPAGRRKYENFKFNLPVFGEFFRVLVMERFSSEMSTLVESGVPILYSLEITEHSVANLVMSDIIREVKEDVRQGKPIAKSLEKSGFFEPIAVQMVAIGEEIGELSNMFKRLNTFYQEYSETFLTRFTSMFEPAMLIFMGALIGIMVIGMFLPIFQIAQIGSKG